MRLIDADALLATIPSEEMASRMAVVNAPTINQWIPTSERYPEEQGSYICSCKDGNRDMVSMIKWQPRQKAWNLTGQRAYWRVIAWQYLPEPYKGDEK